MVGQKACIYCNSDEGPFDIEHVFSAGMGGNDNDYILVDTVCKKCNNIFSRFEATLMRRSVVALARIFLQPYGRKKGKPPEIETLETHVIDEFGNEVESDHFGSKIENLAQISFFEGLPKVLAKDSESLESLLEVLSHIFDMSEVLIVKRITQRGPHQFEVSTYIQGSDEDFRLEAKKIVLKAPQNAIWLGYDGSQGKDKKPIKPRIFLTKRGRIDLKTHDSALIGKTLGDAKKALPKIIEGSSNLTASETHNPLVCMTAEGWSDDCNRAIAKIGFNLLAHRIGKERAFDPVFDKVKKSILFGDPLLPFSLLSDETVIIKQNVFGIVPKDSHCLLLYPAPTSGSEVKIMFVAMLYGSIGVWAELAEHAPLSILSEPTFYVVNYIKNKVEAMPMMEYTKKHNPVMMAKMPFPYAK